MPKRTLFMAAISASVLLTAVWIVTLGNVPIFSFANCSSAVIPPDWAQEYMAEDSPFYEALLSPEAQEKVLSAPRLLFPVFSTGGRSQIDNIRAGKVFVDKSGPLQSLDDVDWSTLEYGRYYATQLHGFVGMGAPLQLGEKLPDAILEAIGAHIEEWGRCVARNPEVNKRSWYEGTVIKRQANLLYALNYLREWGDLGGLEYDELIYLIDANARFLLDTDDIYSFGNHGIRQDMLLAATAIALPSHPRAGEMLRLAEERLDDASRDLFTESGIWKEHAPGYVNYMINLMEDLQNLHDASEDFNPVLFLGHAETSLQYLVTSLLPNERIPDVGMSAARRIVRNRWLDFDTGAFLASRTRTLSSFPDYGHAVVRGDHPNGLYLLFVASQNLPVGKRHTDDLSLLLYNHDRPWISEGGHQSYKLSGMTRYLRTSHAHNTYTLNGQGLLATANPELDTELTGADIDGANVVLSGYTERFRSPARFERQIEVHDFSQVTILDRLRGEKKPAQWEGRFHFPRDLETRINGNTVTVSDPAGLAMTLRFQSDADLSFTTCQGQEKPICGWGKARGEFGPLTTLMWSLEGDADVKISIEWND